MNNQGQGQSYPNIMWREIEGPRSNKKKKGRCITNAMMRAIAIEEAKQTNKPRYRCNSCNEMFALTYSKFMRDTNKPFVAPTYVCRDCAKKSNFEVA